ncbi:hypothetical protein D3C72_1393290 [compost metagenome]
MRIAMSTPLRISGSPPRPIRRVSDWPSDPSLCVATSLPVSTRPQAAALTNIDGLLPTWAFHSPWAILSRISTSRVAASGMRSRASARHISAMPSCDDSANSCSSPCTKPARPASALRSRSFLASSSANASPAWAMAAGGEAWGSRSAKAAGSGLR